MGISRLEYNFLKLARQMDLFPQAPSILEFGEAEIINFTIAEVLSDAQTLPTPELRETFSRQASVISAQPLPSFGFAKLIYRILMNNRSYRAVDLSGTPEATRADLNQPLDLGEQYDLCINNGTSEHIFNQYEVFKTFHRHTRPGGTMIHWTPTIGWIGHGLYNAQPGFFFDLASANDYEVGLVCLVTTGKMLRLTDGRFDSAILSQHPEFANALACAVLRKPHDLEFRVPQQGCYANLVADPGANGTHGQP